MYEGHRGSRFAGTGTDLADVPFSHVEVRKDGRLSVQLSGALPGDWLVRVASALAARGSSLHEGYARRIHDDVWLAQLDLERAPGDQRIPDLLTLARTGPRLPRRHAYIRDFELGSDRARPGTLHLRVVARDGLGLIATVLARATEIELFVDELLFVTEGEAAIHTLALRGPRGVPSQSARRVLAARLSQIVRTV